MEVIDGEYQDLTKHMINKLKHLWGTKHKRFWLLEKKLGMRHNQLYRYTCYIFRPDWFIRHIIFDWRNGWSHRELRLKMLEKVSRKKY